MSEIKKVQEMAESDDAERVCGHDNIVKEWVERSPKNLDFPPNCFHHMSTQFVEWHRGARTLIAHIPCKPEFYNPRHYMQGGFVVAALDNVLGPLSYLSGVPSVTVQLNTTFVRPVAASLDYIVITAAIVDKTSSKIFSTAEARAPSGKLLTTVQATSHIIDNNAPK